MWMTVACGPLCCDCSKLHQEQAQTARVGELARLSQKELESQLVGKMDVHSLKTSPHVTLRPTYDTFFFVFWLFRNCDEVPPSQMTGGGRAGRKWRVNFFWTGTNTKQHSPKTRHLEAFHWRQGRSVPFRVKITVLEWLKKNLCVAFCISNWLNFIIVVLLHCNGNCNMLTVKHPNQRFARKRKLEGTPIGMI